MKSSGWKILGLAAAAIAITIAGNAQSGNATVAGQGVPDLRAVTPVVPDDYIIGNEDILLINVWKEPDFSGTVPVRPDGKISLALVHDIQAAGLTPISLSHSIAEALKQYVSEPRVTVTVTAMNSRRVYVVGEVNRPGAVTLTNNMTVLQLISMCGGFSPFAKLKSMYVLRTEDGAQKKYAVNYKQLLKGQNQAQNIILRPGDTIVVP